MLANGDNPAEHNCKETLFPGNGDTLDMKRPQADCTPSYDEDWRGGLLRPVGSKDAKKIMEVKPEPGPAPHEIW